ncbi:Peptidase C48, SUMO/Sentrin/Ubl1 [Corchorus olitorius]|uniref:Peptidase C48, SUMO/Sentrin/Ubl1 n=1 Tax=Corchorus olitorius TaxID=93759 RepID=A0A1R3JLJ7_9ROSI|nr:Peptidase C48, SUMO/Sentrin/Ubl1 [Corchorus olitorius]
MGNGNKEFSFDDASIKTPFDYASNKKPTKMNSDSVQYIGERTAHHYKESMNKAEKNNEGLKKVENKMSEEVQTSDSVTMIYIPPPTHKCEFDVLVNNKMKFANEERICVQMESYTLLSQIEPLVKKSAKFMEKVGETVLKNASNNHNVRVIVDYKRHLVIQFPDFDTLKPTELIMDTVIDVLTVACSFYEKFKSKGKRMRRWYLDSHIKILIPVHEPAANGTGHWFLVALNIEKKKIDVYDSLTSASPTRRNIIKTLIKFCDELFKHRQFGPSRLDAVGDIRNWEIVTPQQVPRQSNPYDCGVYVMEFMRNFHHGDNAYKNVLVTTQTRYLLAGLLVMHPLNCSHKAVLRDYCQIFDDRV